jgi:hypothetical protein
VGLGEDTVLHDLESVRARPYAIHINGLIPSIQKRAALVSRYLIHVSSRHTVFKGTSPLDECICVLHWHVCYRHLGDKED